MIRTQKSQATRRPPNRDGGMKVSVADREQSSTELVIEHITAGVLAGRYVPGQRLVEADLTHALGVSRGPVREAFRRLDALGVLSRAMHRGACVRTLTRTEAVDLLLAAEPLVGLIARLAALEIKAPQRRRDTAQLTVELKSYRDRKLDLLHEPRARQRFYEILMALTGNSQLPSVFPTMRIHLLRLQVQSFRETDERQRNVDDFADMAKAVLDGDAKLADRASIQHNRSMIQAIGSMPDAAFPRISASLKVQESRMALT